MFTKQFCYYLVKNKSTMIDCSGYKHTQMLLEPHCGALILRQQLKKKNIYIHYIAKSIGSPRSNEQVWLL